MKLTITREQLQEGLVAVAASVPAKTTLPILSNILLEATKDGIRLSGTDLDISVSTTVPASVDQEGAITLPARKLVEIVRELPSAAIRLTGAGEQRVTIECGRSRFRLLGLPREEFPAFPAVKFEGGWKASGEGSPEADRRTWPSRRAPKRAGRSSTACCGSSGPSGCGWWPPTATGSPGWTCPPPTGGQLGPGRPDRAAQGAGADPPALRDRRDGRDRPQREPPGLPLRGHPDLHPAHRGAVPQLRAGDPAGERQGRPRPTRPPSPRRSAA